MQAVQKRGERRGPRKNYALIVQKFVGKPADLHGFGKQPLDGQIQYREIGGFRHADIFALYADCFGAESDGKRLFGFLNLHFVLRVKDVLIGFEREFRVDGQHYFVAGFPGKIDDKVHAVGVFRLGKRDVFVVLLGRKKLRKQVIERHFAPGAARFHVGQNPFKVGHSACKGLHFAKAFRDCVDSFGHHLERFLKALFQIFVQIFVDGRAHFVKLLFVALVKFF